MILGSIYNPKFFLRLTMLALIRTELSVPSSCADAPPANAINLASAPAIHSIVDPPAPHSNVSTPSLVPVQPADANVDATVPSGTTGFVRTKTADSNVVATPVYIINAPTWRIDSEIRYVSIHLLSPGAPALPRGTSLSTYLLALPHFSPSCESRGVCPAP